MTEVDISVSNVLSWYHNLRTKLGVDTAKADDISQAVCYIDYVEGDNPQRLVYSRFQKSELPQVQMLRVICDTLLIALADKAHSLTCPQSHKVYGCQCKMGTEYADLAECVTILQYLESLSKDYSELIDVLKDFGGIWEEFGFSQEERLRVPETLKDKVPGRLLNFIKSVDIEPIDAAVWYCKQANQGLLDSIKVLYTKNKVECSIKLCNISDELGEYYLQMACSMQSLPTHSEIRKLCQEFMMAGHFSTIADYKESYKCSLLLKRYIEHKGICNNDSKVVITKEGVRHAG